MENFTPQLFTSIINSYLPEPHASLLNGMLFGINLRTSKSFYEQLKAVGLLHLVVLSGMNITLVGSLIINALSFFSKITATLLTILIIIIFIVFVGAEAPVIRAGFMGILTLVAFMYGRKNYVLFALFLSAIFTFLFWPSWLKSISFQLSYGATLGIIIFGKTREIKTDSRLGKLLHYCQSNLKISLAAQIFTAPIIFLYFKQISLVSPFSNLFVSFLIGPLTMLGFITAFLGKIDYSLGILPAYLCYGLLSYMILVIETLAKLPFVYFSF